MRSSTAFWLIMLTLLCLGVATFGVLFGTLKFIYSLINLTLNSPSVASQTANIEYYESNELTKSRRRALRMGLILPENHIISEPVLPEEHEFAPFPITDHRGLRTKTLNDKKGKRVKVLVERYNRDLLFSFILKDLFK